MADKWAPLKRAAAENGLDWRVLAAITHPESGGNPGAIGDGGHAYGWFQLNNAGGTITGDPNPRSYLDPYKNASFAARAIAQLGIGKLPPNRQIAEIVKRFERPAAPTPEIASAQQWYAQTFGGKPGSTTSPLPATTGTPQTSPDLGTARPPTQQTQTPTAQTGVPTTQPSAGANPQMQLLAYLMTQNPHQKGDPNAGLVNFLMQPQAQPTTSVAPTATNVATTPATVPTTPTQSAAGTPQVPKTVKPTTGATTYGGFDLPANATHVIGTPYAGTHTVGNWESDNALDIAMPKGSPIYAVADGKIGSQFGSLDSGNPRFAGLRLHLQTKGNEFYYAHLSRFAKGIVPGMQVKKGQIIGYSGVANGVAHLHIGAEKGNPLSLFGFNK